MLKKLLFFTILSTFIAFSIAQADNSPQQSATKKVPPQSQTSLQPHHQNLGHPSAFGQQPQQPALGQQTPNGDASSKPSAQHPGIADAFDQPSAQHPGIADAFDQPSAQHPGIADAFVQPSAQHTGTALPSANQAKASTTTSSTVSTTKQNTVVTETTQKPSKINQTPTASPDSGAVSQKFEHVMIGSLVSLFITMFLKF